MYRVSTHIITTKSKMATQKMYKCSLCIQYGQPEQDFTRKQYFQHMKTDEHKECADMRSLLNNVPLASMVGVAQRKKVKILRKHFTEENIENLKMKKKGLGLQ